MTTTPTGLAVRVEPMRRRHLRAVLRIEAQTQAHGWSLGLFLAELGRTRAGAAPGREPDRNYLVALAGGRVVGFGAMLYVADDAHLVTMSTDPAVQRRGVASRLLLALCADARAAGAEQFTLEVRAGNEAAIALYRRFGFAPAGVRKGYYADNGEDALVLWATDVATDAYAERLAAVAAQLDREVAS
jgi:ribosomal-protein-alanine N-acetyltransferase